MIRFIACMYYYIPGTPQGSQILGRGEGRRRGTRWDVLIIIGRDTGGLCRSDLRIRSIGRWRTRCGRFQTFTSAFERIPALNQLALHPLPGKSIKKSSYFDAISAGFSSILFVFNQTRSLNQLQPDFSFQFFEHQPHENNIHLHRSSLMNERFLFFFPCCWSAWRESSQIVYYYNIFIHTIKNILSLSSSVSRGSCYPRYYLWLKMAYQLDYDPYPICW